MMKGLITRAVLFCTAAGTVGCYGYRDLVDPCYPERYEYAARQEVKAALTPQVQNGHVLDQTVWNYHFDIDVNGQPTSRLNAAGLAHLARLARTRPQPDPVVYLQTAQDLGYDPDAPDRLTEARNKMDAERTVAVQKFLNAQTSNRPMVFQVQIHDPAEVGSPATPVGIVIQKMYASYTGSLGKSGGASTGGSTGGTTGGSTGASTGTSGSK